MKNSMEDVRNHLVAMLEVLGDDKCTPEAVERAKATSLVAGQFVSCVKTELEAYRLADEIGKLPSVIQQPTVLRAVAGGRG